MHDYRNGFCYFVIPPIELGSTLLGVYRAGAIYNPRLLSVVVVSVGMLDWSSKRATDQLGWSTGWLAGQSTAGGRWSRVHKNFLDPEKNKKQK
jgi:hypothetical protein